MRIGLLALALGFAAFIRFDRIDGRSLWADEFCTWRVSRMPLGESLRWGPELTKPPLYQLILRAITATPRPDERTLRLPAAIAGTVAVVIAWWIGSVAGHWTIGFAAALLTACNGLQIDYSQEARSYSMLAAGTALSTCLWHRIVTDRHAKRARVALAYVVVTALTFHAHYLTLLTAAGQAIWGLAIADWRLAVARQRTHQVGARPSSEMDRQGNRIAVPAAALFATAALCLPIALHYLRHRSSLFQGLGWIAPPTWSDAMGVLGRLTFGPIWAYGALLPAALLWIAAKPARTRTRHGDIVGLLLAWIGSAWLGLLVISWVAHPAMIDRYALPAAMPAILLPLVVAHRLDRRAPWVIAVAFFIASAGQWTTRSQRIMPGFREMVEILNEVVDPERQAVVVAIDRDTSPGWEEMDLLGFDYYPLRRGEVHALYLRGDRLDGEQEILRDPRGLYVVTFLADPVKAIESSGRVMGGMLIGERSFERLLFSPYRLVYVLPRS